jgi:hypothetical protein
VTRHSVDEETLDEGVEGLAAAVGANRFPPPIGVVRPKETVTFWTPKQIAEYAPAEVPWIVQGYVAESALTELIGAPKSAGKTTWLMHLVRAVLNGSPFIGQPTKASAVIYATEERFATLRESLSRAGLLSAENLRFVFKHQTRGCRWAELVGRIAQECDGRGLVIIDTLAEFAGLQDDNENTAGGSFEAMDPLKDLAGLGVAVIVTRHQRKAGGPLVEAGRGSSSLTGQADIVLRIKPAEGNAPPGVRELESASRFDETPGLLRIELTADGYVSLGDGGVTAIERAIQEICVAAPNAEAAALTIEEMAATTGLPMTTARAAVKRLHADGGVCRRGRGVKGDPERYWIPFERTRGVRDPNESNESDVEAA